MSNASNIMQGYHDVEEKINRLINERETDMELRERIEELEGRQLHYERMENRIDSLERPVTLIMLFIFFGVVGYLGYLAISLFI